MNGTVFAYAVVALMALQRLGELVIARRNTAALLARGAVETGAGHYPLIVALHVLWLASVLLFLPHPTPVYWPSVVALLLLQALRMWVITTLGPYWTTRIITLPGAPLVRRGPYRFVRHPNYLVVAGEILALPLAFGEVLVAIVFSLANAAILYWRIRQEDTALRPRRAATS
jgi:methyltransferase